MKFTTALLASLFVLPLSAAGAPLYLGQSPGPVVEWRRLAGGNDHFYQAIETPGGVTWSQAREIAGARGGYLATLESAQENQFVFKLIDHPKYWVVHGNMSWGPWLGGERQPGVASPELGWVWGNSRAPFGYTNWAPSEPFDTPGEIDDHLQFMSWNPPSRQPTWNNLTDTYSLQGLVVEYDTDPALLATPVPPLAIPLLIASLGSLLIFLAGVYIVFFRRTKESEKDVAGPIAPS